MEEPASGRPSASPVSARLRLAAVVWAVLVSQVLLYPGLDGLIVALGAPGEISAGMWFLVAEYGAFISFALVWGAASDALGRRAPLVVVGAVGGAASYLLLASLPALGVGFGGALAVRGRRSPAGSGSGSGRTEAAVQPRPRHGGSVTSGRFSFSILIQSHISLYQTTRTVEAP